MRRLRELGPVFWVFASIFVVHAHRYATWTRLDPGPYSDGHYIYLLARSLAYDGDLDMTNDYAICGDPRAFGQDHGTGHPANPYYIGPSTIWVPTIFVARHLVHVPASRPRAEREGCRGPIPFAAAAVAPVFVTWVCYLGYRLARRLTSRTPALVAAVIVAFGSALNVYGTLWWPYAHLWAAAALTAAVLALVRVREAPDRLGRWCVAGAAIGWATLMRPHHGVWVLAAATLGVARVASAVRSRRWPGRELALGAACAAAFVSVFALRLISNRYLYGQIWPPVVGKVYLQWGHGHPFLMLFSARAGLFHQTPFAWFAAIGSVACALHRRTRWYAALVLPSFLLDAYICSTPLEWTGGWTVGPRLWASFCGLFVPWTALPVATSMRWLLRSRRRLLRFALVGWLAPSLLFAFNLVRGHAPYEAPARYGEAFDAIWREIYRTVGNPFTLPGTAVFAMRYRAHPRVFNQVADYGVFEHDLLSGRPVAREHLYFARLPREVALLEGFGDRRSNAARLHARRPARMLVPLAWPYVTDLNVMTLDAHGAGCRLTVRAGTFFHTTMLGSVEVLPGPDEFALSAPPGAFDSGIMELTFESNCDVDLAGVRFVDATVRDTDTELMHPVHGTDQPPLR